VGPRQVRDLVGDRPPGGGGVPGPRVGFEVGDEGVEVEALVEEGGRGVAHEGDRVTAPKKKQACMLVCWGDRDYGPVMRLTDEHAAFRASVRSFVESEIDPHADAWEDAGIFPAHELFPKAARLGLLGLERDPQYGGEGADHSFQMVAAEELGRSDVAGVAMAIGVQSMMATPSLAAHGTDELKRTYLAPALAGQQVAAIAVTEPDTGSDVAQLRTRAVRDGEDWVITGSKTFITNGTQADWLCLLARTSDEGGYRGMSQILVPTASPGFSVAKRLDKLGNRCSETDELRIYEARDLDASD